MPPAPPGTHNALLTHKYEPEVRPSQEGFMMRNHIAPTYHGPVFVVEDVWVRCSLCAAAVDPVVRIPVGKQWFHPKCLRCAVCARPSRTDAFRAVKEQPVCSDCFARGFDKALQQPRGGCLPPSRGASRAGSRAQGGTITPRRAISPSSNAATPLRISAGPSPQAHRLPSTPFLDTRSITKRQSELLERQRLLTEGDLNILMTRPMKDSAAPSPANPTPSALRSPISAIAYQHKS